MATSSPSPGASARATARRVLAARAVLWAEAACAHLWPAASLLLALAALGLFDVPAALPLPLQWLFLLAGLAAFGWLLWRAWPYVGLPGTRAAERRLERDSGLLHRPFDTMRDRPAGIGAASLWQLHRARALAGLARLRLAPPRPELARHDPRALRVAAVVLLGAGLVVAGPRTADRLAALWPGLPEGWQPGPPPTIQAWIQPPAYTGLPPVFLPPAGAAAPPVTVPAGSRLTLSVTGLSARPGLSLAGQAIRVETLGHDSFQASLVLDHAGRLRLGGRFSELAGWDLALLPNEPPAVSWPSLPGRAGTAQSTRLPWRVQQRWGVARLEAELRPQGRPDLPAVHLPLPLPGTPRQAQGSATADLSADPYAGVPMTGRLHAQDVSGQHGESAPADFVLPARVFRHPLARAIADLRRRLALHPEQRLQTADELAALAEAPLAAPAPGLPPSGVALNLSADASLLGSPAATPAETNTRMAEVQARLWALALALDGALPDASTRALAEARDTLRRGIEDHANGKLSDKDLSRQLDQLRQALDKRLEDLAKRAMQQGALQKFDPHSQHLSAPALDQAIRKLEQALQQGRTEDARKQMAELERMMDQLKNAHIMTPEEAHQQREQAKKGRQQAGAVQDMVQREAALLDHAQSRAPGQPPALPPSLSDQLGQLTQPPQDGNDDNPPDLSQGLAPDLAPGPPAAPGQGEPNAVRPHPAPTRNDDARTQRALRRALDALKDGLAQAGRQKPASLVEADHAMQDAAGALADGQDPQARDAIARAIAALQQGGQDMARQSGQQSGAGTQLSLQPGQSGQEGEGGQEEAGDGQGGRRHDPFGRPVDGSGTTADDPGLRVPEGMEGGRSRAIQEELRRRGADRARPKGELDYIGRLLKPF